MLASCSSGGSPNTIVVLSELYAAISFDANCTTNINFEDFDHNVYGYRADALFTVPSIQTGGHSTLDESTDLGFNLFIDINDLNKTSYTVTNGGIITGTAYVFYKVGGVGGEEFTSTGTSGTLEVERLTLDEDKDKVLVLKATMNNVEIANINDPSKIRCVNNFKIEFYR